MSIIVNTNTSSINAQRSLSLVQRSLDKSLERLASGLRINHASDDAAGLAISTGLDSQIRGLGQAIRNAGDGQSLIGTAEGATTQQVEILQRIRELAVQAANDINSPTNRLQIQQEINAQISELTRIGNTVQFNGSNLIDGTFQNKLLQVGAMASQTISISIGDFRASAMGALAVTQGQTAVSSATVLDGTNLTINGANIGASANYITADTLSNFNLSGSAIAKAAAINASYAATGVTATVLNTTFSGTGAVTAGTISSATMTITINGVTIFGAGNGNVAVTGSDGTGTLRGLINAKSLQTGVIASLSAAGGKLIVTAADGRNVNVNIQGAAAIFGAGYVNGVGALGDNLSAGTIKLSSDRDINLTSIAAANVMGFANSVTSVDATKVVNTIDATTQSGADQAIQTVDAALKSLASAQSQLGAITNRLENTIRNLQVSIENLSASQSRIRDADFAQETANLTRAQILQQAGTSVLSQANLRPQAALALLGQ